MAGRRSEIARYPKRQADLYFPAGIGLESELMSPKSRFSLSSRMSYSLVLGLSLLAIRLVFSQASFGQASSRPNIVFIFTDDHCHTFRHKFCRGRFSYFLNLDAGVEYAGPQIQILRKKLPM